MNNDRISLLAEKEAATPLIKSVVFRFIMADNVRLALSILAITPDIMITGRKKIALARLRPGKGFFRSKAAKKLKARITGNSVKV